MTHGLVVVGGSIAGTTAAQAVRAAGWDGPVVLVDAERSAYSRPALSKGLLTGGETVDDITLTDPTEIEVRRGARATALDLRHRRIVLDDETQLEYDALVVATGGRPRSFGVPGEHTLRTIDDALALAPLLCPGADVTVVGGGLLAMELASTASARGANVTLVARTAPLVGTLGRFLAGALTDAAREHGVRLVVDPALAVTAEGDTAFVHAGGQDFAAPTLLTAIGDHPNTEWFGLPTRTDRAVAVDDRLRASERVWGAGDAIAVDGAPRTPHWDAALRQAHIAARNAVSWLRGEEPAEVFAHDPYFWTEAFGLHLKVAGVAPGTSDPIVAAGDWTNRSALLHWPAHPTGSAISVNHRLPVTRLRAMTRPTPTVDASALVRTPAHATSKEMP